jgi:uncharacterized protein (DUF2252 family)
MHDDSVLVAIDAALRSPAFCACGNNLTITVRGTAAYLECASLTGPSRLPTLLRELLHDRSWVVDVPAAETSTVVHAVPTPSLRVSHKAA